jgi:RepB DNA-primase from phage plasmid
MTLRDDQHDPDEALDFLAWAYPRGPWCLTAVAVDQLGIDTRTFRPEVQRELCAFLALHHLRNIYWSVNLPIGDLSKKAEKIEIAEAHFLHVDVDPRAGEDLAAERVRILGRLEAPPDALPRPSCVVFSGGGYQALWRLTEPFVIGGDLARAEELESYNRQLELSFGADHCHNVDRILRLPGSVNFPNAKKRAKGRVIERARVVM